MNLFKISFLLVVLISLFACNSEPKKVPIEKEINPIIEKKEVPKKVIIKKEWDSLRPNNVIPFFTEYGKQNKETVVLLQTKYGNIKMKLYDDTPLYRANFIFLSKNWIFQYNHVL